MRHSTASAHLKAIDYAVNHKGVEVFNIGTGTPYSVLDIINTFEKVNGVKVNYEIGPRRAGDLPELWADVSKAANVLHWQATRSLEDMCRDAWNWQCKNSNGYEDRRNICLLSAFGGRSLKIEGLSTVKTRHFRQFRQFSFFTGVINTFVNIWGI